MKDIATGVLQLCLLLQSTMRFNPTGSKGEKFSIIISSHDFERGKQKHDAISTQHRHIGSLQFFQVAARV
jgi:hypothetical protein